MILPAQAIRAIPGIITPFCERTVRLGRSFGLSSAGYDVRVAERIDLAPGEFTLASTIEHFAMPDDVLAYVHDKSSWARLGIACQNTVIEPGWRGYLTLEITNHGAEEQTMWPGDPIAQIIFHRLEAPTEQPYTGKYQDQQAGPQPARFERSEADRRDDAAEALAHQDHS